MKNDALCEWRGVRLCKAKDADQRRLFTIFILNLQTLFLVILVARSEYH